MSPFLADAENHPAQRVIEQIVLPRLGISLGIYCERGNCRLERLELLRRLIKIAVFGPPQRRVVQLKFGSHRKNDAGTSLLDAESAANFRNRFVSGHHASRGDIGIAGLHVGDYFIPLPQSKPRAEQTAHRLRFARR